MYKRVLLVLLLIALVLGFSIPTFVQEEIKVVEETVDKEARKITINGTDFQYKWRGIIG